MKYLEYPELELLSRALTFESAECKVFTRLEAYSCKAVNKEKRLFKSLESNYARSASVSPPNSTLDETLSSPFGRLDQPAARKTLFLLIATLNGAFPDHDFSQVNPADFRREASSAMVLNSLSTTLLNLRSSSNAPRSYSSFPGSYDNTIFGNGGGPGSSSLPGSFGNKGASGGFQFGPKGINMPPVITHPALSGILDDIMCISECEVYTFHPDMDSDPHASAEPEEEGSVADDDRYDDWSDDDDTQMLSIHERERERDGTPRAGAGGAPGTPGFGFEDEMDTPLFDEDVYGTGLGSFPAGSAASASSTSSHAGPRTPRTPTSSARTRAGDYFAAKSTRARGGHNTRQNRSPSPSDYRMSTSMSMSSSSAGSVTMLDDDEDELENGGAGLLWATYAFFYNRRMKRILFVSVWSRKNSRFGLPTSTWAMAGPGAYTPTMSISANPNYTTSPASASAGASTGASASTRERERDRQEQYHPHHPPSPAKRAISHTSRSSRTGQRTRTRSSSPAPSAMSPFPHASPQAPSRIGAGAASAAGVGVGPGVGSAPRMASLDGTILSASAPAGAGAASRAGTGSNTGTRTNVAVRPGVGPNSGSGSRPKRQSETSPAPSSSSSSFVAHAHSQTGTGVHTGMGMGTKKLRK